MHHMQFGKIGRQLFQYRGRVVGAVVIDHQQFKGDALAAQGRRQLFQRGRQMFRFVIRGNQDGI